MLITRMLTNHKERIFSSTGEDMDLAGILTAKSEPHYGIG
jgi:hypothetical protein